MRKGDILFRTSSIAYPLRLGASGFAIAGHWNLIDVDIRR